MDKVKRGYLFQDSILPAYFADNGIGYTAATRYEDFYQHIDYHYQEDGEEVQTIDVKAPKKYHMDDTAFTTNILIEYTGTKGYPGWVRGEANKIGFFLCNKTKNTWHLVEFERQELQEYVETISGIDNPISVPKGETPPLERWITRNGEDRFIWIKARKLLDDCPSWKQHDVTVYVYSQLNQNHPSSTC